MPTDPRRQPVFEDLEDIVEQMTIKVHAKTRTTSIGMRARTAQPSHWRNQLRAYRNWKRRELIKRP
jgi:hypothetical protein